MNDFRLEVPIDIRFRDIDSFGHVNNAVYFTYCEIARTVYGAKLFGPRHLRTEAFIMAHAELDYRSQAGEGDEVVVGIRVLSIGQSSFEFEYRIVEQRSQRLIAEGRSVQVTFDYRTNQKVPLPESVKDRILSFEGVENVTIRSKSQRG